MLIKRLKITGVIGFLFVVISYLFFSSNDFRNAQFSSTGELDDERYAEYAKILSQAGPDLEKELLLFAERYPDSREAGFAQKQLFKLKSASTKRPLPITLKVDDTESDEALYKLLNSETLRDPFRAIASLQEFVDKHEGTEAAMLAVNRIKEIQKRINLVKVNPLYAILDDVDLDTTQNTIIYLIDPEKNSGVKPDIDWSIIWSGEMSLLELEGSPLVSMSADFNAIVEGFNSDFEGLNAQYVCRVDWYNHCTWDDDLHTFTRDVYDHLVSYVYTEEEMKTHDFDIIEYVYVSKLERNSGNQRPYFLVSMYNYSMILDEEFRPIYMMEFLSDEDSASDWQASFGLIDDGKLYISMHIPNRWSPSGSFIAEIGLSGLKPGWVSELKTSNTNFIITKDAIYSGFGFSGEADYIYKLSRETGETIGRNRVDTAPHYFEYANDKEILLIERYFGAEAYQLQ